MKQFEVTFQWKTQLLDQTPPYGQTYVEAYEFWVFCKIPDGYQTVS
jgi:hypothetical protein